MDVSINLTVGIISQCIHISNHHIVHFKYITVLSVNYVSINLGKIIKSSLTVLAFFL